LGVGRGRGTSRVEGAGVGCRKGGGRVVVLLGGPVGLVLVGGVQSCCAMDGVGVKVGVGLRVSAWV
jgi:hypothetical protein